MKKLLLLMLVTVSASHGFSQILSGTLVSSGRRLLQESSFTIPAKTTGVVVLELAVNPKGEVTVSKVLRDESTITSTPQIMKAQNASKKLKFTAGTHYQAFEHVKVKYTYK